MELQNRKILLCGIGFFEQELLRAIAARWHVVAVDMNKEKLGRLQQELPGLAGFAGDASSILTWKKLNVQELFHVIITIRDHDVALEVCRIVREAFQLDIPITRIAYDDSDDRRYDQFNICIVRPVAMGVNFILNRLEKNYVKAGEIGQGKGEIIEVPILSKSHLVDRKLKYLRPTNWHVAAIYRDGQMIIPTGESRIRVKDRVVLLGEPKVLENIAGILLKGEPRFPLQFGQNLVFPAGKKYSAAAAELRYLHTVLQTRKLIGLPYRNTGAPLLPEPSPEGSAAPETGRPITSLRSLFAGAEDTGLFFVPFGSFGFFERRLLKVFCQKAAKPFLLARGMFPYQGVIAGLNGPEPASALELGMDISRLLNVPFHALYVTLPHELRGTEEETQLKERQNLVYDFEGIYKKKIPFTLREGNPVKEAGRFIADFEKHLLILLYSRRERFSVFQPHVPFLIARKTPLSTLLIPIEAIYES